MLLISCRGNMAFSLPYFDVRFDGAILVKARPKRNISATVVADVKRFSHQINTDEVFGTHSRMTVTGNLRDVMKESISAAASYVRRRAVSFGIKPPLFDNRDIHVHVPEGATPKDGPSAGVAMATAIVSVMTGIPVRRDVAMTGEITLRGRVWPIAGLKEKLLAAL